MGFWSARTWKVHVCVILTAIIHVYKQVLYYINAELVVKCIQHVFGIVCEVRVKFEKFQEIVF